MAENLDVEGRLSVRTPMQWTDGRNAGFSSAPPSRLRRPVTGGRFGPLAVNVEQQESDPGSLLNWMERVIRRRRQTPEFGWGRWSVIDTGEEGVLVHRCDWGPRSVLAVHNLDARPVPLRIPLEERDRVAVDLLDDRGSSSPVDDGVFEFNLQGYGYRWLRLLPE